jgi:hypothetical protein
MSSSFVESLMSKVARLLIIGVVIVFLLGVGSGYLLAWVI